MRPASRTAAARRVSVRVKGSPVNSQPSALEEDFTLGPGETRTVDAHVQTLRRKLNDARPGAGDLVQTVRGVGYRIREASR